MTEETKPAKLPAAREPSLWARAAWTALPLAAVLVGGRVLLPGVDEGALPGAAQTTNLSIVALGVMPFVSASLLVELCALVVPSWALLRHGGPEGRRKLGRAAAALGLVLAVMQGYGVSVFAAAIPEIGHVSWPIITATLAAGSACLFLLAEAASARGLASSLGVLVVVPPILAAARADVLDAAREQAPLRAAPYLAATAAVALATWYVLERRARPPAPPEVAATYREPAGTTEPALSIPLPASGVAPLILVPSLIGMVALLGPGNALLRFLSEGPTATAVSLALTLGVGVLLSWLFNRPARVAAVVARARGEHASPGELAAEAHARLRQAVVDTLVFLTLLLAIEVLDRRISPLGLAVPALSLAVALALDLAAEWRARRALPDLVAVWPEHRPYAVPAAREALAAAGIPSFARGERLRRLIQFGGPYVPIDLMVPRPRAEEATRILTRVLLGRREALDPAEAALPAFPLPPGALRAPLALLVILVVGALVAASR